MEKTHSTYIDNENVCKDLGWKLEAREYLDILHAMYRGNLDPCTVRATGCG